MRRRSRSELLQERRLAEQKLAKAKAACFRGFVLKRIKGKDVLVPAEIVTIDHKYDMAKGGTTITGEWVEPRPEERPTREEAEKLQAWMRKVGLIK